MIARPSYSSNGSAWSCRDSMPFFMARAFRLPLKTRTCNHSTHRFWRHFGLRRAATHSDYCFFAPCTKFLHSYLLTYFAFKPRDLYYLGFKKVVVIVLVVMRLYMCRSWFEHIDLLVICCLDVDECEAGLSDCTQICENTLGSYTCACQPGFQLSADNKSCFSMCRWLTYVLAGRGGGLGWYHPKLLPLPFGFENEQCSSEN